MNISGKNSKLAIALVLVLPSYAMAQGGWYGTAMIGHSEQSSDSEAIGNNIAVDPDFPAAFDAGDGTAGGIGIGYRYNDRMRVEGRITHREGSFNDRKIGSGERTGEEYILNGDIKSTSFTIEGFYDFPNNSSVTPYIKAGIGVSDNSYAARLGGQGVEAFDPVDGTVDGYYDDYPDGDSTEFSWNVGVGATVAVSNGISAFAEYQYASFGDVKTGQDSFTDGFEIDDISTHEVMLGIQVNF